MKKKNETDWIGTWFALAREQGRETRFSAGFINTATNQAVWYEGDHEEADGPAWFINRLKDRGYNISDAPAAKIKAAQPPFYKRPLLIYRALKNMKKSTIPWKEFDPARKKIFKREFDWIAFTKEETEKIFRYAGSQGVNINSLFLKLLTDIVVSKLVKGPYEGCWLFPIGMRGLVSISRKDANVSSAVMIRTTRDISAQEIHSQLKRHLKNNVHWGAWWLANIGKVIGMRGMRYITKNSIKKFHLGTYSFLGEWPPAELRKENADPDEVWVTCSPGSPTNPIGSNGIIWYGRLSWSLKIHPSILTDQNKIGQYLNELKGTVLKLIS